MHIDEIIDAMNERAKLILENEVIDSKKGNWYLDYCSSTTYYKIREEIYKEFLSKLEK